MKNKNWIFTLLTGVILLIPGCSPARKFDQDSTMSAFKYREVYLPEGIGKGADALNLNDLDQDWGIWGHNLSLVLPEEPSESVYAKVNGSTLKQQYCFSSPRLFDYIEEYIVNNYGEKDKARFAIIPNDNDIVCLDAKCVEAGNTPGNASPAVIALIRKLSERFPNHVFYTSDYRTTRGLPNDTMPSNSGVMVSAMPYPLTYAPNEHEAEFLKTLDNWGDKTKRIMVWDYINNFDDYFTPFPIFGVMQNRFRNYKNHHVTGVFLNGSGTEASSLSHLKTIVLAELTANPDTDWRKLLMEKATELYPVTGETIANFMLAQEDYVRGNGALLPLYEGVPVAIKRYLPEDEFMSFHDQLIRLSGKTEGHEKEDLDLLLQELALTRLELNRINGNVSNSEPYLASLEKLAGSNVGSYNESGWQIDRYIEDYRYMIDQWKETGEQNKLKGQRLKALTPLDEDYSDIRIITDGLLGIPSNYHNGHLITSPEKETVIQVPYTGGSKKLVVWLSYNTGYKLHLPAEVVLSAEGMSKEIKKPEYPKNHSGHSRLEFDLPSSVHGDLTLTFKKDPETRSMSIEEIELL